MAKKAVKNSTSGRGGGSPRESAPTFREKARPYLMTLLLVSAVTLAILPLRDDFDKTMWGPVYLFILVAVAVRDGLYPAIFCALYSFLSWNWFFLAPYGALDIATQADWAVLFTFLIAGISIGIQTSRLRRREQLTARMKALEESDRLKNTLVSLISHELKTPLASVTATVTNLLEQDMKWNEEDVRRELSDIRGSLSRLDENISALIELSRLKSDAWRPSLEVYELGDIVGTTLARLPSSWRENIRHSIPPDLPVRVDFNQISRAIRTVVENAILYGEDGLVILLGSRTGDRVCLRVEDRGLGIPDDEKERVFEKFYRGRNVARTTQGTGIGLALAREIVDAHGGEIRMEDAVPHGTRVVMELPLAEEL